MAVDGTLAQSAESTRQVAGGGSRHRLADPGGARTAGTQNFLRLAERATDVFAGDDSAVLEDVKRTLLQVREQYDVVHHEAEQKEARLQRLKWDIHTFDSLGSQKQDEVGRLERSSVALEEQLEETKMNIFETKTSRKVYEHMLARIQKEQAVLRQKILRMEEHVGRKGREHRRQQGETCRTHSQRVQASREHTHLEGDAVLEREARERAKEAMDAELTRRRGANARRADFERWRHEVALEAANEAFNATAGRLRKLYAIEKLSGNFLQKTTNEQLERSNTTEEGFQRIREVTGLTDVMDIVHKFLNRDVEHEQLKGSVKDAEVRLEALRQDFDAFKRDTEGIAFDTNAKGPGDIYKEIEQSERKLNDAMEEHEHCRNRLQKTTLQVEHMKRWSTRVGMLLSNFEEPVRVEGPADLANFFRKLQGSIEKFSVHVAEQILEEKVTPKSLSAAMTREFQEQSRLLSKSSDFLKSNCRVVFPQDDRHGSAEDTQDAFEEDREKCKRESDELHKHMQAEQSKKQKGIRPV